MICALIRSSPDSGRDWTSFLELATSLALFGQPVRVVVLESAGDSLRQPSGMLEETLVDLAADIYFESALPAGTAVGELTHQCQHCVVF